MKQILPLLRSTLIDTGVVVVLALVYWWGSQLAGPPIGNELQLIETAREALHNHGFFYPTYNEVLQIPISPLLTVFVSAVFKFFSTTIITARALMLVISLLTLYLFYVLASRFFHTSVGMLSTGFILASWGFFTNSHLANGAMLYVMLVLITLMLFFHWFDSAFRSRTFAKSLYVHFILIGCTLGLMFCTFGLPGVAFPLLIMGSSVYLSNRTELFEDIHYTWMLTPMAAIILIWSALSIFSIGFIPYLQTLLPFSPGLQHIGEPILYFLPVLPLIVPAVLNKDMWNRAILSYQKSLFVMAAWMVWSGIYLIFFSKFHEAFSLLLIMPAILWIGFYLSEVFRNPIVPNSLQWVVDSIILLSLFLSVIFILLTDQIAPPGMGSRFLLFSLSLPTIAVALLFLRDVTISRAMPMYLIPCGLLLCMLTKYTIEPLFLHEPTQVLAPLVSQTDLKNPDAAIIEWAPNQNQPTAIRFLTPLQNKVLPAHNQVQLESLIQTRRGPLYMILPEAQYYDLPDSVREDAFLVGHSWQWNEPLTLWTLWKALQNETLSFSTLSHNVLLVMIPDQDI